MSMGALVAVIGLLMTWIGFAITMWRFRNELRRNDEEAITRLVTIARRECEAYHHTEEHGRRIENKIRTTTALQMDEEFRKRASSFVDAGVYSARHDEVRNRIDKIENTILANTREIGAMASQVATLNAYLRVKFGFDDPK